MIINEAGEYTLQYTATDACGNSTTVERELTVEAPPYYGAVWDGSDSPQWTRTGLASDFADPQPAVNNGTGSSPFDNIMPWSGMQIVEDADAGTLVSIPKFYYQWVRDELNVDSMELRIANEPLDGFFVSPAHADRGDGVGERDVVYVGRYHCSATDYKSTAGVLPKVNETRQSFRTNIHSLGNTIWQFDYATYWTIAMLFLVEFANWNSQSCIGYGCGSSNSLANEGATDLMQYHTGTNAITRDTYGEVQYRHIEGLWSNIWGFIDGIRFASYSTYCFNNPSEFSDDNGGTQTRSASITGTSGKVIVGFEFMNLPTGYEYALFPIGSTVNGYSKYVSDAFYFSTSGKVLRIGGECYDHDQDHGLFNFSISSNATYTGAGVGSRLMKLPSE